MKLEKSEFQFKNPTLNNLIFCVNDDFKKEKYSGLGDIISNLEIKRKEDENRALVILRLKIGEKNDENPFYIDICMQSEFVWSNLNDEMASSLLKLNAPSLLVSYMRPYIAAVTNGSKYPIFNLPFIDFNKSHRDIGENK
ncbi:hypothetical protein HMPREF0977_01553 [Clostridium sp. 1_1_41A1FAA]|nr:hypothetical protein HMPREF0977_01553 [Clostridium sp. 1_1_41A1FAA]